jgi:ATP-binding cassette subfamily G (WHITE) protein 2 (SNQ2)
MLPLKVSPLYDIIDGLSINSKSVVSGFLVAALIMYTGYMIPKVSMHPWLVWIYWIDPLAYGFQSLLANEFHNKIIPCVGNNLVPLGPTYGDIAFQSCAGVMGAVPGATSVTGDQYLAALRYSHSNVWRNIGIVWAMWVFFVVLTILATSGWKSGAGGGGSLVVPRELTKKNKHITGLDEESQTGVENVSPDSSNSSQTAATSGLIQNTSVFTWKNLTYTVKTPSGDRVLLDNVQGWVKPGMLGAL